MNIAVLSGKGGTGKTLVATNLAMYMKAEYIDADVEEPNGFIFLKPVTSSVRDIKVDIPYIEQQKCNKCYKCVDFCKFNSLAKGKNGIIVFEKLCHSCGGCKIVCTNKAIDYIKRNIGIIEEGRNSKINCKRGVLNVGEPMATKIIEELINNNDFKKTNIIDSSPGTSCNIVSILQKTDIALLVTEATKFGLHDLDRAVKLVKKFNIPFGVIINRVVSEDNIIDKYCKENNIEIIQKIRYDKNIAQIYSKGDLLINYEEYNVIFKNIFQSIKGKLLCKYRYLVVKVEPEKQQLQLV